MMHAANIVYGFNGEFYGLMDARIKPNMRIRSKARFDIYRLQATEWNLLFLIHMNSFYVSSQIETIIMLRKRCTKCTTKFTFRFIEPVSFY